MGWMAQMDAPERWLGSAQDSISRDTWTASNLVALKHTHNELCQEYNCVEGMQDPSADAADADADDGEGTARRASLSLSSATSPSCSTPCLEDEGACKLPPQRRTTLQVMSIRRSKRPSKTRLQAPGAAPSNPHRAPSSLSLSRCLCVSLSLSLVHRVTFKPCIGCRLPMPFHARRSTRPTTPSYKRTCPTGRSLTASHRRGGGIATTRPRSYLASCCFARGRRRSARLRGRHASASTLVCLFPSCSRLATARSQRSFHQGRPPRWLPGSFRRRRLYARIRPQLPRGRGASTASSETTTLTGSWRTRHAKVGAIP